MLVYNVGQSQSLLESNGGQVCCVSFNNYVNAYIPYFI